MPSSSGVSDSGVNPAAAAHRTLATLSGSIPAANSTTSATSGAASTARSVAAP